MVEINWNKLLGAVLGHDDTVIDGDKLKVEPKPTASKDSPAKMLDLMGAVQKIGSVAMDPSLHDAIKNVRVSIFGDGTKTVETTTDSTESVRRTLAYTMTEFPPNNAKGDNGSIVLWVMLGVAKDEFAMRIGEDFVEVDTKALTYNPDNIKDKGTSLVGAPFEAAAIAIKLPCKVFKTPVSTSYTNGVACVVLNRVVAKAADDSVVFD